MNIESKSRNELKGYFRKNSIPTESNFADLIDGMINPSDDGIVKLPGNPLSISADGSVQQKVMNFYLTLQDETPVCSLSLNPTVDPNNPASEAKAGFSIGDSVGKSRLFIDKTTGNVGIGTITPKGKLDINGALIFKGNSSIKLSGESRSNRNALVLKGNWNELEVKGRVIDWTGTNLHIGFDNDHAAHVIEIGRKVGSIKFLSGGGSSETMRITGGKVGIGTANPQAQLHIRTGSDAAVGVEGGGALILGDVAGVHLALDNNEIMAKANGTTASTLHLQSQGGKTIVGANLQVVGQIHINTGSDTEVGIQGGGALILGNVAGAHLAMDNNEIMAKANGTTAGVLHLQHKGGKTIVGADLQVVGQIIQENWRSAALVNGWVRHSNTYNTPGYFKDSLGIVHLRGLVKNGAGLIFTLPVGYRPVRRELQVNCTSPNVSGRIDIEANGKVTMVSGKNTWFSLDGITFRAA